MDPLVRMFRQPIGTSFISTSATTRLFAAPEGGAWKKITVTSLKFDYNISLSTSLWSVLYRNDTREAEEEKSLVVCLSEYLPLRSAYRISSMIAV